MLWIVSLMLFAVGPGCSRSSISTAQSDSDPRQFESWKPTKEAIDSAKRRKEAPPIVVQSTRPPRASAYDLNPRAAMAMQQNGAGATDQTPADDESNEDPAFAGVAKPPPPPMPPKLRPGDEADQFGLPEWERMARGDLHVKRIRY